MCCHDRDVLSTKDITGRFSGPKCLSFQQHTQVGAIRTYCSSHCMVSSYCDGHVYSTGVFYYFHGVHTFFISIQIGYHMPLLLLTKAVTVLLCCLSDIHGITDYVKPTEFDYIISCPKEPCHALNYFASNTHNTWSGVVLSFLPGNHSLNQSLYISSNSNLHLTTFHPVTSTQSISVSIHCPSMANFHFNNVSNITIDGLSFHSCGLPEKHLFKTSAEGTLHFQNVTNFCIKMQS